MAGILQSVTSTLMVKLPEDVILPTYQEKIRVKKTILRSVIRTLQTRRLELLYVGYKPEYVVSNMDAEKLTSDRTIVSINVLEDNGYMCDFNTSQEMLLKRFKKELQSNNEHIVIDRATQKDGFTERTIEIYIKCRYSQKSTHVPHYTLAMSSGFYAVS